MSLIFQVLISAFIQWNFRSLAAEEKTEETSATIESYQGEIDLRRQGPAESATTEAGVGEIDCKNCAKNQNQDKVTDNRASDRAQAGRLLSGPDDTKSEPGKSPQPGTK